MKSHVKTPLTPKASRESSSCSQLRRCAHSCSHHKRPYPLAGAEASCSHQRSLVSTVTGSTAFTLSSMAQWQESLVSHQSRKQFQPASLAPRVCPCAHLGNVHRTVCKPGQGEHNSTHGEEHWMGLEARVPGVAELLQHVAMQVIDGSRYAQAADEKAKPCKAQASRAAPLLCAMAACLLDIYPRYCLLSTKTRCLPPCLTQCNAGVPL